MPPFRLRGNHTAMSNDDWEIRAVALAQALDEAAAELRDLVGLIRTDSLDSEQNEEQEKGDDERRPEP